LLDRDDCGRRRREGINVRWRRRSDQCSDHGPKKTPADVTVRGAVIRVIRVISRIGIIRRVAISAVAMAIARVAAVPDSSIPHRSIRLSDRYARKCD
jgi:hypothetical protein